MKNENYEIITIINGIALIKDSLERNGLIDLKTSEIIVPISNKKISYNERKGIFYIKSYQSKTHEISIDIYDALTKEYVLRDNFVIKAFTSDNNLKTYVLKSKKGKYHIFDEVTYKTDACLCTQEFDYIDTNSQNAFMKSEGNYEKSTRLILTRNDLKGIFKAQMGLVTRVEYNDITFKGRVTIFEKDGKKYFEDNFNDNKSSEEYDDIKVETAGEYVYLYKDGEISVYSLREGEVVFKIKAESIKYSYPYFIVGKDGFYSLIEKDECGYKELKCLDEKRFDKIERDDMDFKLYTKDEVGILIMSNKKGLFLTANYDSITKMFDEFYICSKGEEVSVLKKSNPNKFILNKVILINTIENKIHFKDGVREGLLIINDKNSYSVVYYDKIKPLFGLYYFTKDKNSVGLNYRCEEVISTREGFKSIHIKKISEKVICILKGEDKKCKLASVCGNDINYYSGEVEDASVVGDLILVRVLDELIILNKELETLMSLNNVVINKIDMENIDVNAYNIDGKVYIYWNGSLEEVKRDVDNSLSTYRLKLN